MHLREPLRQFVDENVLNGSSVIEASAVVLLTDSEFRMSDAAILNDVTCDLNAISVCGQCDWCVLNDHSILGDW